MKIRLPARAHRHPLPASYLNCRHRALGIQTLQAFKFVLGRIMLHQSIGCCSRSVSVHGIQRRPRSWHIRNDEKHPQGIRRSLRRHASSMNSVKEVVLNIEAQEKAGIFGITSGNFMALIPECTWRHHVSAFENYPTRNAFLVSSNRPPHIRTALLPTRVASGFTLHITTLHAIHPSSREDRARRHS